MSTDEAYLPYTFYTKDIMDILETNKNAEENDIKLYLSPEKCYMQFLSHDYAVMVEAVLTPLYKNENQEGEVEFEDVSYFENYQVIQIYTDCVLFDGTIRKDIKWNQQTKTLTSSLPKNSFLINLPNNVIQHMDEYMVFEFQWFVEEEELKIKFGDNFMVNLSTAVAEVEDDNVQIQFSTEYFKSILENISSKSSFFKLYIQEDFPLCIEIPYKNPCYYFLAPSS